jgi:hypothetical protein
MQLTHKLEQRADIGMFKMSQAVTLLNATTLGMD